MAHVAVHVHRVQEQVYHVLDGEGVLTLDGRKVVLRRHDCVHIPSCARVLSDGVIAVRSGVGLLLVQDPEGNHLEFVEYADLAAYRAPAWR